MKDVGKEKEKEKEENLWTDECEALLAEWSEKASCYRWLHGRCEKSYRKWYYCFSIPVIILSTLTGAANVGMDSFVPAESKSIASAAVGGVNIFAGIISTLQNFLKVAELMEGHRIAGVSWGKLQRNIAIELALDPSRRVIQSDFLKISRAEYDRLIEAGPIIDDSIIKLFNSKFANYEVSIPSICNGLDKCTIYKLDETIKMNKKEFIDGIEDLIVDEEKISINNTNPDNLKISEDLNDNISTINKNGINDNENKGDRVENDEIMVNVDEIVINDGEQVKDKAECTCNVDETVIKEEIVENVENGGDVDNNSNEGDNIDQFLSGITEPTENTKK